MLISNVSIRTSPFSTNSWLDQQRVSTPLSWFSRFAERRSSWRGPGADLVSVLIRTDDGAFGIGQTRGGAVTAALIESHFGPLLIGQDPRMISQRTEELRRAGAPYAQGGILSFGIAAIELALWDLVSRSVALPLTDLLGGHHDVLPYYLTCPDPSGIAVLDPSLVSAAVAVKIPAQWGPADGSEGLERTVAAVTELRSILPGHVPIAIDCFMSWDLEFATRFALATTEAGVTWIEEPFLPRDYSAYVELRRRVQPIRVAGGEHLFELGDALAFMACGAADILQVDVTWFGGIVPSRIAAGVAEASGLVFAPHGGALQPWAVHLVAASGPTAIVEVIASLDGTEQAPPRAGTLPGVGLSPESLGFTLAP